MTRYMRQIRVSELLQDDTRLFKFTRLAAKLSRYGARSRVTDHKNRELQFSQQTTDRYREQRVAADILASSQGFSRILRGDAAHESVASRNSNGDFAATSR